MYPDKISHLHDIHQLIQENNQKVHESIKTIANQISNLRAQYNKIRDEQEKISIPIQALEQKRVEINQALKTANDQEWQELITEIMAVDIQVIDLYIKRDTLTEQLGPIIDDAEALMYSAQLILLTRPPAEG